MANNVLSLLPIQCSPLAEYHRTTYILLYHFKTKCDPRGVGDLSQL